jgi:hypothetical protein
VSISSKKTYSKIIPLITEENNKILNKDEDRAEEFIYKYFTIKSAIDNTHYDNKTPIYFINEMISALLVPEFVKLVDIYIDENYKINVDSKISEGNHRYDVGTTFLDRHFKIIYKISALSRLVMPLATHYIHSNPQVNTNTFLMDLFQTIFNVAQLGTNINIYAKLYTYINKAVTNTLYTDKVMWDRLMILGVTKDNVIDDTMCKIVTNIFIKYSFDFNPLHLITVVVRKSIMSYTLRKKDPFTLYSLSDVDGVSTDDESIINESEIFDSYNTQRDESIILMRKYGTPRDIKTIQMRENVNITQEEFDFYLNNRKYHELQKSAICFAFSRYTGGVENIIGGCRKEDWITLMIILMKVMKRSGMEYLANFISAYRQQYSYRRMSKYLNNLIDDNPLYNNIVDSKYSAIRGIFEKKNFIKNMIVLVVNNTYTYNLYGNDKNGLFIEKDEPKIVTDVLAFFNTFIM